MSKVWLNTAKVRVSLICSVCGGMGKMRLHVPTHLTVLTAPEAIHPEKIMSRASD